MFGLMLKRRILIGAPNHNFVKGFVITDRKLPFSDITERTASAVILSVFILFSLVQSVSVFEFEKKNGV